jgi:hypothetical protein
LTINAPGIAILLNMAHSLLEWITALGAEEVAKVPVFSKGNGVFTKDSGLAMLAFGSIKFVPVEVTEIAKSSITVFWHGLTLDLFNCFPSGTTIDPVKSLGTHLWRLLEDLESLQTCPTSKAYETFRVVFFNSSSKPYYTPFNRHLTLMTSCSCSFSSW